MCIAAAWSGDRAAVFFTGFIVILHPAALS
jgi:hypothetical protein